MAATALTHAHLLRTTWLVAGAMLIACGSIDLFRKAGGLLIDGMMQFTEADTVAGAAVSGSINTTLALWVCNRAGWHLQRNYDLLVR